jgi:hypothetical protein
MSLKIDQYCRLRKLPLPDDNVLIAAAFLESHGFRFLVDYGFENTVEKADRILKRQTGIINFSKRERPKHTSQVVSTEAFHKEKHTIFSDMGSQIQHDGSSRVSTNKDDLLIVNDKLMMAALVRKNGSGYSLHIYDKVTGRPLDGTWPTESTDRDSVIASARRAVGLHALRRAS